MKAKLTRAIVEKDVENAYREEILRLRECASITSPHNTDGYAQWDHVRLLLEAKLDLDLKSRVPVCNTLGQCLLYLKRFEASSEPMPNVILVGDRNECFVLSTASVKGFLDLALDWTVAPSKGNPELTRALVEGVNILPYVFDVDNHFSFRDVLEKVETLAQGQVSSTRATQANLSAIFIYWRDRVFNDPKLTAVEEVDVFLRCLFHPTDVFLHPTKMGVLVVPGYQDGVLVHADPYRSFFDQFQQGYKPSEVELFYANKDRLVEDDARRRQGAFFTPSIWVEEAHKAIENVLGKDWKRDCIVWDPAAGTGNLTRDFAFDDLVISTAEKPDVAVIKEQGYNPGASVFQYDFLNPGVESPFFEDEDRNVIPASVDRRLREAAKAGKRLVWFMNPPYGTAGIKGEDSRAGIADTLVNRSMKAAKLGAPSQQLYAQFMFQCNRVAEEYGFEKHTVALFSKPTFMSSGGYRKLREWWFDRYEAPEGGAFLFQASHFADVSDAWGISFTVWNSGTGVEGSTPIPCTLKDINPRTFGVVELGVKTIYNADDRDASKWSLALGRGPGQDSPQMSSGLRVKGAGTMRGSMVTEGLLYATMKANSVMCAGTFTFLTSSCSAQGNGGCNVLTDNWRRSIALYSARKLVTGNWINDKDEYLAPATEGTSAYEQWVDDAHVYALLHNSNNCTAMRDVAYKGKKWQISNHFFWLRREDALNALDNAKTPHLHRDCKQNPAGYLVPKEDAGVFANEKDDPWELAGDPYMAEALSKLVLSPDAQEVLDRLTALWLKSLPLREAYSAGKPELHLNSWDSGLYQLKHLWRDLYPEDWKELQTSFKALAERLQPGVYEHGFLLR